MHLLPSDHYSLSQTAPDFDSHVDVDVVPPSWTGTWPGSDLKLTPAILRASSMAKNKRLGAAAIAYRPACYSA